MSEPGRCNSKQHIEVQMQRGEGSHSYFTLMSRLTLQAC